MRELYNTGWMHNRVRMIVGSFLVKDLIIDWREGLDWFNDTLVDADEGNNIFGWQWIAGCGADAAPYFRIFNPLYKVKSLIRKESIFVNGYLNFHIVMIKLFTNHGFTVKIDPIPFLL